MKVNDADLHKEIELYTRYLIGHSATPKVSALYLAAITRRDLEFEPRTIKMVHLCLRYPLLIGLFDAATGIFERDNEWRKRLILAFAILETQPEYLPVFQPQVFGVSDLIKLFFNGIGSGCRAFAGKILLWMI